MSARSAIRQGLEAVSRQPALVLAEITWRWCSSAAAWLLVLVAALEYLNAIPVSWRERLLVESGEPLLMLAAVAHAVRGSAARLAGSAILAGTAIAILWIACAALGRLVTLKALQPDAAGTYPPFIGLSFLRAALFLAAFLAAGGALVLAGFAGPAGDDTPSLILASFLIACIWLSWILLNWLLSLAAIFLVRDQQDTFGAVAAAVELIRTKFGELVLTSLPFVLLHGLALAAAVVAGVLIFDLMTRVSLMAAWALPFLALGYFAYADFLYITRLGAYMALAGPGRGAAVAPALPQGVPEPGDSLPPVPGILGLTPES